VRGWDNRTQTMLFLDMEQMASITGASVIVAPSSSLPTSTDASLSNTTLSSTPTSTPPPPTTTTTTANLGTPATSSNGVTLRAIAARPSSITLPMAAVSHVDEPQDGPTHIAQLAWIGAPLNKPAPSSTTTTPLLPLLIEVNGIIFHHLSID
jgi:hypothetical protein